MKHNNHKSKVFLAPLVAICCISANAQTTPGAQSGKRAFTIEDVYRIKTAYGPTVSSLGSMVYTLSSSDLARQSSSSNIFAADGRALTSDGKSYSPQWSTDGKYIYFTSSRSGLPQVWREDASTLAAEQITDYKLGVQGAVVSPNGQYIAFAAEVDPDIKDPDGSLNKQAIDTKRKNPIQAHLTDHLLFRHWTEYSDGRYWHIIIYDTKSKTYTDVTPGRFHSPVFSPSGPSGFVFSPDSKELCYLSNHEAHPEASTNCDLWTVNIEEAVKNNIQNNQASQISNLKSQNLTADNKAWDGSPQYSPDGRYIAYRFQRTPGYESDRFILGLIDRKTGKKSVLTEGFDNWVDDYKWSADSKKIYFIGEVRGVQPLYSVDIKSGKIKTLVAGKAITSFDIDRKGNIYYNYSTTGKPTAIYKNGVQLTHYNDSLEAAVDFRPSEEMWVKGADGDSVEVFIVKPHGFDPSKKYPLVINVHGGPQMQWMNSYRADWQVYPGAGYVVAYPNPHGSTGYGQKFCRDISGSWGGRPFEDVMKVTDALAQLSYVDSTRMGAMGWSYGGYFMNWLQGNTKRFKCLASMMGLYDLRSMWGATEELWFPNFDLEGQPWNSPLYKKWSPSEYVKNFATPTLIITGERDYRVPYTQALQYFSTLQTLGIPSRLIVYDNDGHWPSNLKSMPLYYNAHLEWFHKYLGGDPAPWNSEDMVKNAPYLAQAKHNPVLPGFHADPEILYSNKMHKYYIYSTTDGTPGWGGWQYYAFSSDKPMGEWKNEGVVLDAKTDQISWANGNLWAPAAIEVKQPDGSYKYYLYFSARPNDNGRKQIGVAVADSPTGPFKDLGHALIAKNHPGCNGQLIDVDVFQDPVSKKYYLYWGNSFMAGAELEPSMTALKDNTVTVLTPKGGTLQDYAYREAPYVFYRNGIYYFMWSVDDTGSANYHVAYGTSKSPLGPIEVAKDPIVIKQDAQHEIYGTAHNSVIQVPGTDEWYIVYHRINKAYLNNQPGIHREVCVDRLKFNADGTIQPVVPTE